MRRDQSLFWGLRAIAIGAVALSLAGVCAGCGDDVATPDASTEGAAASAGAGSSGIEAPVLLEVTAFSLALKITWETHEDCDFIEAERKTALTDYEDAFEVPGSDTVYVDEAATADQTYTYRLRCKVGDALSTYSNEKTGNPMKF